MDVLSLLKFWRNAGIPDFDITADEGSFFDLELTNTSNQYHQFSKFNGTDSNSNNNYPFTKKTRILPLDSSNTKTLRSPFRVLKLGFQNTKTKSEKKMKCEMEEVTICSLLKSSSEKFVDHDQMRSKRYSNDVVQKYFNLIKPLYVRVSRRSNENVRLPEQSPVHAYPATASVFSPRKEEKRLGGTVFKEVRKHWVKSRSSSVKPAPAPVVRSDDSALQQDGIQSAILHCKKSYDSPSRGCHDLSRSGSAPSQGPRISIDEVKRSSI
ncbi:hypothetical protein L1987_24752 [Smallanthus sonchifolius]|uniref:Uncharacterized protein n=1 Tax=Smallanthus sonchifolius TaxID=185202 RepID=A0ACB9ILW7_9ASTR|nr:hypothetical protein L1987_24752 [Smallanthus sonchifolius]